MKDLDKELEKTKTLTACSWAKAVSKLKKNLDAWTTEQLLDNAVNDFKLAYMPLIMNIDTDGVTNTELARRAGITKQGMSQVVQELEEKKYIKIESNPGDKRSSIIRLTEKGKAFVLTSRTCQKNLHTELQKVLGKARFDMVIEAMYEVIDYHEDLNRKKNDKR